MSVDFAEVHRLAQALADATGERVPFSAGTVSLVALPAIMNAKERCTWAEQRAARMTAALSESEDLCTRRLLEIQRLRTEPAA